MAGATALKILPQERRVITSLLRIALTAKDIPQCTVERQRLGSHRDVHRGDGAIDWGIRRPVCRRQRRLDAPGTVCRRRLDAPGTPCIEGTGSTSEGKHDEQA